MPKTSNKLSDTKLIKQFTPEEKREYNNKNYQEHIEARLDYQASYYQKHKEEIKRKANQRYRRKCGLLVYV